jgi:hypothetical protein
LPPCSDGTKGAEKTGTLGWDGKSRLPDNALTVGSAKPEIEEGVLDPFVGFAPPTVGPVDLVEGYADAHGGGLGGRSTMFTKPPAYDPDLEVSSAGAAPRSPVSHPDRDRDGSGVRPVQPLHEGLRGSIAAHTLQLLEVNPCADCVRDGHLTDVGQGRRMLAVVADIGEEEGRIVDLTVGSED